MQAFSGARRSTNYFMKSRAKKNGRWVRLLAWLGVSVVALLLISTWMISSWVQNYLKSDACRLMLAGQIGGSLHSRVAIEPMTWSGANVFSGKITLDPLDGQGWKQIEADGVQATLDRNAAWHGVWKVPSISVEWLRMEMRSDSEMPQQVAVGIEAEPAPPPRAPTWWSRWLPKRTEIGEVEVQNFELKPPAPDAGVAIMTMKLSARPAVDDGAWLLRGEGGKILLPQIKDALRLTSASARLDAKTLSLNDAVAQWIGDSDVTGRGELPFEKGKAWNFTGRISNLDLRHVLSADLKSRLSGVLESSYETSSQPDGSVLFKGKPRVKNGIVQGFPVLERVADFTTTERFRRVVLDEANCEIERQGSRTKITRLVMQSNGLIRIEGDIAIDGILLTGNLMVGVSPETLRWMPGAQNHVFIDPHSGGMPGFVWTTVRVSGTIDAPKEDLSNRLLAAMGKALLIDAPMEVFGKGVEVLGKSGNDVLNNGQGVIESGKNVIKGAGDAVDILNGIIPLFPK